jgi:hypothetical protein
LIEFNRIGPQCGVLVVMPADVVVPDVEVVVDDVEFITVLVLLLLVTQRASSLVNILNRRFSIVLVGLLHRFKEFACFCCF